MIQEFWTKFRNLVTKRGSAGTRNNVYRSGKSRGTRLFGRVPLLVWQQVMRLFSCGKNGYSPALSSGGTYQARAARSKQPLSSHARRWMIHLNPPVSAPTRIENHHHPLDGKENHNHLRRRLEKPLHRSGWRNHLPYASFFLPERARRGPAHSMNYGHILS